MLEPILGVIGARKLRERSAADVRQALAAMAAGYSTAAVTMGHLALKRAIRHAEANDLVARNVAALADTPKGQHGRPSKSLTLDQAAAVITAARTLPVMELRPGLKDVRRPVRAAENPHNLAADLRLPDLPARQAMTNQPIWQSITRRDHSSGRREFRSTNNCPILASCARAANTDLPILSAGRLSRLKQRRARFGAQLGTEGAALPAARPVRRPPT